MLAQWRAGAAEDDSASLFAFFRHAVVGASLVLVLCAVWSLSQTGGSVTGDEAARLDYDIQNEPEPMTSLGKRKLAAYVLAIFLAGAGSGALVAWQVCQRRSRSRPCRRRKSARACAPGSSPAWA